MQVRPIIEYHDRKNDANGKSQRAKSCYDKSLDNWGKVDLTMAFQNTDNNQTEYVYTRDSIGRVDAADCCLNVHQNKVLNLLLHNENGSIIDVECYFKKMGEEDNTNCSSLLCCILPAILPGATIWTNKSQILRSKEFSFLSSYLCHPWPTSLPCHDDKWWLCNTMIILNHDREDITLENISDIPNMNFLSTKLVKT